MLRSLTLLALAAALSLPSGARAVGTPVKALGLGGPLTARSAIEAAVDAEVAAALAADTVEVARYATLAQAVAATVTEEAKLTAGDGSGGDVFGESVSLDGDRALVGVPFDDNAAGNNSGAAYVFAFDASRPQGQQWSQEAKLTAADAAPGDVFGESVSLDGDRALVGASRADNAAGSNAGAAYVFAFNGAAWSQEAKLVASDGTAGDGFGESVSLSGERVLVGALEDNPGGSAYTFAFDGATWTQEAKLTAANTNRFGASVSLDGNRALIGDAGDTGNGFNAGAAHVFAFDGTTWSQQARLTAPDASLGDQFGESVSLDGDQALIGAIGDDDGANFSGSAYVYAFNGATWSPQVKLTASDPEPNLNFGGSVSLDCDRALVGAYRDTFGSGSAYVFSFNGTTWSQQAKFSAADVAGGDEFGYSVSLDGDRALVGARADDNAGGTNAGSAYVFDLGLGAALVADAGPDQTVVAGQTVTLDGTASVGAQTFAWTLGGAPVASTAAPSFCAAAPGTYALTLTVTDGAGGSASDAVTVTAQSPSAALDGVAGGIAAATQLSRPQKGALIAELRKAQRALDRGVDPAPFFDAFRAQVLGLQSQGVLTAGQAGVLVGLVDAVAAAVASPCNSAGAPTTALAAAAGFELAVYPNPTADRATVAFTVETAGPVRLSVVDALGREVAVLTEGPVEAGPHRAELDASAWPAGVYLVRLVTADGQALTQRISRVR